LSGQPNPDVRAASEAQLIARAQRGDEEAFAAIFQLHKRRVFSLCLRMAGDMAEAEDLAQDAFMQLFRKIGTFRGESAFSTWLHRLVVNVVLMHLRKKGIQKISLEETDNSQEEPIKREYGDDDRWLLGSIDRITLTAAIDQLPHGYKTIFILHDVEGYEHNEIAQIMKCSVGNSKSQLHKARLKLREILRMERGQGVASKPMAGGKPGSEGEELLP
jgi:RNA polymerase sigma-70 factor (ECF subfamily)